MQQIAFYDENDQDFSLNSPSFHWHSAVLAKYRRDIMEALAGAKLIFRVAPPGKGFAVKSESPMLQHRAFHKRRTT